MPERKRFVEIGFRSEHAFGRNAQGHGTLNEDEGNPGETATSMARRRRAAILLMCGAVFCFAGLDASSKWASQHVDPIVTTWFRYAASVAMVSLVLNPWTRPRLLHSNRFFLQVLRSILLFLCTILNFFALPHLQLAQSISIQFAMPIIVALLAGPLLGEWAGPRRLAAIGVGFLGVLVVTRPGAGSMNSAAWLVLGSTILYACYALVTRMLAAHDPSATTITYSGLAGVLLLTPVLPFFWTTPPTLLVWLALAATGLFGAVGHGFLTLAHARAPAPVLSPFIYTQLIWMVALGYLVFGDVPDGWTFAGAAIVIASGLYLLIWERARGRVD
ncbi:DMT family transporter [uncultured Enterovirga sp.]|uniref:DMT family transporter n=1 Tax=uncultured Enterovirga sp. TaxID=2026352 RepID=UPI0035C97FFF